MALVMADWEETLTMVQKLLMDYKVVMKSEVEHQLEMKMVVQNEYDYSQKKSVDQMCDEVLGTVALVGSKTYTTKEVLLGMTMVLDLVYRLEYYSKHFLCET